MKISGRSIALDNDGLARALTSYLLAQGVVLDGPRTIWISINDGPQTRVQDVSMSVYVEPDGRPLLAGQIVIDRAPIPTPRADPASSRISRVRRYRRHRSIEAARWIDTDENRGMFADWFDQHYAVFATRGPVAFLPENRGENHGRQVQEGAWILFTGDDWLAMNDREFRSTYDEISMDSHQDLEGA